MKKTLRFISSMKFGMVLLLLILITVIPGSLIVQMEEASFYETTYSSMGTWIIKLGLDDVYHSWYLIGLCVLLGINLFFCSMVRVASIPRKIQKSKQSLNHRKMLPLTKTQREALLCYTHRKHFRKQDGLYSKHILGFYGSFVTHLGLLMVLIFGMSLLSLSTEQDVVLMPGETVAFGDQLTICADDFRIRNEEGTLDYLSHLTVTVGDQAPVSGTSAVNEPMTVGPYKFYQQAYLVYARMTVEPLQSNQPETIVLSEATFLSLDGQNGLQYMAMADDFQTDEEGRRQSMPSSDGAPLNPLYLLRSYENGLEETLTLIQGETYDVGGIRFTMQSPLEIPVIRVKTAPVWALYGTFCSFAVLLVGLFLCFYWIPVFVLVTQEGYAIYSPKGAFVTMDLEMVLQEA